MQRFWDLMAESVIFQGVLVVLLAGTTCYLVATGGQVPNELWTLDGMVVGYFFGAKQQQQMAHALIAKQKGDKANV